MNPTFLEVELPPHRRLQRRRLLNAFSQMLRKVLKFCLWQPLRGTRLTAIDVKHGTSRQRFCRGLLYRLSFLPVLTGLAIAALVYAGTHPRQNPDEVDPNSLGIYYEPVTLRSEDGISLDAWVIPACEAGDILRGKENALRLNHPAILLVHDYGKDRQQMLPFIKPLHDEGFVVMAIALRGCGSSASAGSTFGLLESGDVRAAIASLRKSSFVDPQRLAIVGIGTGANAALLTAKGDTSIKALTLFQPAVCGALAINDHIGPQPSVLKWLRPMCACAFELTYQVHLTDLDMLGFAELMQHRKVLLIDKPLVGDPATTQSVARFLAEGLST